MGITKSGTRVTVRYESGDSFGNTDDPFNYQRVIDAITSNGWVGLYAQKGNTIIFENISIYVEGIETAFVDDNKNVFYEGAQDDDYVERIETEVAQNKRTNCLFNNNSSARRWYDANVDSVYNNTAFNNFQYIENYSNIENTGFRNCRFVTLYDSSIYKNITLFYCETLWIRGSATLENIKHIEGSGTFNSIFVDGRDKDLNLEFNEIELIDEDRSFCYRFADHEVVVILNDSVVDLSGYGKEAILSGSGSITTILQKRFNTNIQNSSGGTLKIYDNQENEVYSEKLTSDEMTEQKIEYDRLYLENTDGELTAEERTIKEPFTLKVTKTGYQDLVIPEIYCTVEENGSRVGTLSPKTVSGKMERIRYQDREISGQIEKDKELSGDIEVIELTGEID